MPQIAILAGPTASGKTAAALELAQHHPDLELINADSLIVYREMEIGTAKPTREELAQVPHHLVSIRNPDEPFTAGDFVREAEAAIASIHARGKRALFVGGTAFYLKALLYGMWDAPKADPKLRATLELQPNPSLYGELEAKDPTAAHRIGVNDRYRLIRALELITLTGETPTALQARQNQTPDPRFALWVVDRDSDELNTRIHERTGAMLRAGLVEETERLRQKYPESRALNSVGYAQACAYLDGKPPEGRKIPQGIPGLASEIELATRQLVKSQRTFFRGLQGQVFVLDRDHGSLLQAASAIYGGKVSGPEVKF